MHERTDTTASEHTTPRRRPPDALQRAARTPAGRPARPAPAMCKVPTARDLALPVAPPAPDAASAALTDHGAGAGTRSHREDVA